MCYHVSTPATNGFDAFAKQQGLDIKGKWEKYYHVSGFARPDLPVTLNQEPGIIQPAKWKLIPSWVKNEEDAKKYANTLNAESSEIFDKASYKPYIGKYRGLLWIDGFYEPHKVEGKKETDNYYIYRPNKEIFSLGIVYAPWTNKETGEIINTFSVITTPANELLQFIHNEKKRMPLVIAPENREGWLNASGKENIEKFFVPYYDGGLAAHQVQMRVTAPKKGQETNIPEAQQEVDNNPGAAGALDMEQGSLF